MLGSLSVVKSPNEVLSLSNRLVLNEKDFIKLNVGSPALARMFDGHKHIMFSVTKGDVREGSAGFNGVMRRTARVTIDSRISVEAVIGQSIPYISSVLVELELIGKSKNKVFKDPFNTDDMGQKMIQVLCQDDKYFHMAVGQLLVFEAEFGSTKVMVELHVKGMKGFTGKEKDGKTLQDSGVGLLYSQSVANFKGKEGTVIRMTGKAKAATVTDAAIPLNWDFNKLGIGGLDAEFETVFRRAFASRVYPPELVEQLGLNHVRGMLLFGPPGTGKTLIARKIGDLLKAREPKIVNGPEILNKYVGEAESNIRKLFAEAEDEQRKYGNASALHVIILDEIDAICKARGSVAGSSGVHDTVVNQLLSKIDGVEELNNILVIGMTNRKDMIDEALLRPGRLEVQMEIGLPDEHGRLQILTIHTNNIKKNNKLGSDVDLPELASQTKNFSGAEIAGLVRAAASTAMHSLIKASNKVELDPEAVEKLQVKRHDFAVALQDIKPAFGASSESLDAHVGFEIIDWGEPLRRVFEHADLSIAQARNSKSSPLVTVLIEGLNQSGTTALAAKIARDSGFPFIRICTAEKTIGYSESAKCQSIKVLFDDAYKSPLSIIILDDIERLIDYSPIGPRYSNLALQALLVLLKRIPQKGRKVMIIGTTSSKLVLDSLEVLKVFDTCIHAPYLTSVDHLITVLNARGEFTAEDVAFIAKKCGSRRINIGIKKLISTMERAQQSQEDRAQKFIYLMEDNLSLL